MPARKICIHGINGVRKCKLCVNAINRKSQAKLKNKKKHIEQRKMYDHKRGYKIKIEVLSHYSTNPTHCANIFNMHKELFIDLRCLSIDHINGDGRYHVKTFGRGHLYRWLKKNNYPKGFQVLCMNCQWIKRHENNEFTRVEHQYDNNEELVPSSSRQGCKPPKLAQELHNIIHSSSGKDSGF